MGHRTVSHRKLYWFLQFCPPAHFVRNNHDDDDEDDDDDINDNSDDDDDEDAEGNDGDSHLLPALL